MNVLAEAMTLHSSMRNKAIERVTVAVKSKSRPSAPNLTNPNTRQQGGTPWGTVKELPRDVYSSSTRAEEDIYGESDDEEDSQSDNRSEDFRQSTSSSLWTVPSSSNSPSVGNRNLELGDINGVRGKAARVLGEDIVPRGKAARILGVDNHGDQKRGKNLLSDPYRHNLDPNRKSKLSENQLWAAQILTGRNAGTNSGANGALPSQSKTLRMNLSHSCEGKAEVQPIIQEGAANLPKKSLDRSLSSVPLPSLPIPPMYKPPGIAKNHLLLGSIEHNHFKANQTRPLPTATQSLLSDQVRGGPDEAVPVEPSLKLDSIRRPPTLSIATTRAKPSRSLSSTLDCNRGMSRANKLANEDLQDLFSILSSSTFQLTTPSSSLIRIDRFSDDSLGLNSESCYSRGFSLGSNLRWRESTASSKTKSETTTDFGLLDYSTDNETQSEISSQSDKGDYMDDEVEGVGLQSQIVLPPIRIDSPNCLDNALLLLLQPGEEGTPTSPRFHAQSLIDQQSKESHKSRVPSTIAGIIENMSPWRDPFKHLTEVSMQDSDTRSEMKSDSSPYKKDDLRIQSFASPRHRGSPPLTLPPTTPLPPTPVGNAEGPLQNAKQAGDAFDQSLTGERFSRDSVVSTLPLQAKTTIEEDHDASSLAMQAAEQESGVIQGSDSNYAMESITETSEIRKKHEASVENGVRLNPDDNPFRDNIDTCDTDDIVDFYSTSDELDFGERSALLDYGDNEDAPQSDTFTPDLLLPELNFLRTAHSFADKFSLTSILESTDFHQLQSRKDIPCVSVFSDCSELSDPYNSIYSN